MKKQILSIVPSRHGTILLVVLPPPSSKRTVAILRMASIRKIGRFINKAKLIRTEMFGNAFFPSPPVSLATDGVFAVHIAALEAAEVTALTRARGAAQARDVARTVVLNDMYQLLGYVQIVADANPTQAEDRS